MVSTHLVFLSDNGVGKRTDHLGWTLYVLALDDLSVLVCKLIILMISTHIHDWACFSTRKTD